MRNATIHVGQHLCGKLPSLTHTRKSYTVTCALPVTGPSIMITQSPMYTYLQLAHVEVFGFDKCKHDERKNRLGKHKCKTASDCTGARTCSRYQWCQGDAKCPNVNLPTVRSAYKTILKETGKSCHINQQEEELDKDKQFTSWQECAEIAFESGCEWF